MIIFYNKKTGVIVGRIEGRVHNETHLNMWMGSHKENNRIVCNWILVGKNYEPDSPQKEVYILLDQNLSLLSNYIVNPKTKLLEAML